MQRLIRRFSSLGSRNVCWTCIGSAESAGWPALGGRRDQFENPEPGVRGRRERSQAREGARQAASQPEKRLMSA